MGRPDKIWFRKNTGWWMVTLGGKQQRLAQGRENRKLAEQRFHELAIVRTQAPEAPTVRVADIIEAFIGWARRHRSEETLRNYEWYGQAFSEHSGYLSAGAVKPIAVVKNRLKLWTRFL